MVTKTAPKGLVRSLRYPVKINAEDRYTISECLSIDAELEAERLDGVIASIETVLSRIKSRLLAVREIPLPSHVRAQLELIATAANGFAQKLRVDVLHPAVWRELSPDINVLANIQLRTEAVRDAAMAAVKRLERTERRGETLSTFAGALAQSREVLRVVFEAHRADELEDKERASSLHEFQGVCRKYLPRSPNKKAKLRKK